MVAPWAETIPASLVRQVAEGLATGDGRMGGGERVERGRKQHKKLSSNCRELIDFGNHLFKKIPNWQFSQYDQNNPSVFFLLLLIERRT